MTTIAYRNTAPTENPIDVLERQLIAERHRFTMLQAQLERQPTPTQQATSSSRAERLIIRFASRKRNLVYAAVFMGSLFVINVVIAAATAAIVAALNV